MRARVIRACSHYASGTSFWPNFRHSLRFCFAKVAEGQFAESKPLRLVAPSALSKCASSQPPRLAKICRKNLPASVVGTRPRRSKACLVRCLAALLVILLAIPFTVRAEEYELPPMDVMLLIDVSGSMRFTDPNRAALTAAADFIEMLPIGTSRVGVIGFSGLMQYYLPFRPLEDEYVKQEMREEIYSFQYIGFTDIGVALLTAAETLAAVENLRNPMILLISDGWIQISPNLYPRTEEDSYNDVQYALDLLERTVPIYTIGIHNPHGGVDVDLLTMIAERSNAYAQFTEVADELPGMFAQIFAEHSQMAEDRRQMAEEEPEPEEEEPEEESEEDYEPELEYEEEPEPEEEEEVYEPELEPEPEPENETPGVLYTFAIFTGLTAVIGVFRYIFFVTK